jgi:hypothetical protein
MLDADMPKMRTTLTIDADLPRAVKIKAARDGRGDSEVIEAAGARDLDLAVEAQHATGRRRR